MSLDLDSWLKKVQAAKSRANVFAILDEFRPLAWTDDQRAAMARAYMRVVEKLAPEENTVAAAAKPAATTSGDDGPVWYEKM